MKRRHPEVEALSRKYDLPFQQANGYMIHGWLLACDGRFEDAEDTHLAKIYGEFTEGFDTVDLQAGKELLDELAVIQK